MKSRIFSLGDRRRYERVVGQLRQDLYRYALWLSRDPQVAEDVVQEALLRAQSIYRAAVTNLRPSDSPRMCWDCKYWEMRHQRCGYELPESKKSGGRYAARCDLYVRP